MKVYIISIIIYLLLISFTWKKTQFPKSQPIFIIFSANGPWPWPKEILSKRLPIFIFSANFIRSEGNILNTLSFVISFFFSFIKSKIYLWNLLIFLTNYLVPWKASDHKVKITALVNETSECSWIPLHLDYASLGEVRVQDEDIGKRRQI